MTQTRSFLLVLWLVLAFFLWDAWQKDYNAPRIEPAAGMPAAPASSDSSIPGVPTSGATPAAADTGVPAVPGAVATPAADAAAPAIAPVVLQNDVLRVNIDSRGGTLLSSELLGYRQTPAQDSPPVQLLSQDPAHWFVAQTGWVSAVANGAPAHEGAFRAETGSQTLADGGNTVETVFTWTGDNGVTVRRTWSLTRGEYVLGVRDDIVNAGSAPWQGHVYRQLQRVPPPSKGGGMTNPEAYSFVGAAVYSPQDKFEKLAFDDFVDEPVKKTVAGGWIAMLQHYFVTAWIPAAEDTVELSTGVLDGTRYITRSMGPAVNVAPGAQATNSARLYVGPKLRNEIETLAPGLGLTLDYGIFTVIAQPLHWLLSWLHSLTGNWGWAIVLLVVIIKGLLFKLSEAQYKSFAKMRRVQPRIEALKERYGDDKQKFQMAMMELYKKEKINPMGGCLPMLVQIPIFIALYWVLLEAVELRHAPWILWIHNLTAPDPYFVLPALNLLTMWLTQKLSPTPGMDPLQKKMMQVMPLVFGVMFAFFPAGLVLYWATNGALGLLQQYIITRRHGEPAKPA